MSGLVTGLQNRLHPFESGRHLTKKAIFIVKVAFLCMDGGKMHDKQRISAIYDLKDAKNVIHRRKFLHTEF